MNGSTTNGGTMNGHHSETNGEKKLDDYYSSLPQQHVGALWTVMGQVNPPTPHPKAVPYVWRYDELRPRLLEAGRLVTAEEAERRVLMLINPAMKAPHTTDTLYAGLQLILPGETAPAHRHTGFALRYIIEGDNGFTAVEGAKLRMQKGDLILTPSWHWHDHGHEGDGPMIWLDGLDIPLFQSLPINFVEEYESNRYPSKPATSSPFRFPWSDAKKALDGQPGSYATHRYLSPSGEDISRLIAAHAERIAANTSSPLTRETSSFVYHCAAGKGHSTLSLPDGTSKTLEWKANDTFAVPAWTAVSHTADEEDVYLFALTDRPLVKSLGWYKSQDH